MATKNKRTVLCAICDKFFKEHDKEIFNVCLDCQYLFDENLTYVEPYMTKITDDCWIHDYLWVTPEDAGLFVEININIPDVVDKETDTKHFTVNYMIDWFGDLYFERFSTW